MNPSIRSSAAAHARLSPEWQNYVDQLRENPKASANVTASKLNELITPHVDKATEALLSCPGTTLRLFPHVVNQNGQAKKTVLVRRHTREISELQRQVEKLLGQPLGFAREGEGIERLLHGELKKRFENSPYHLFLSSECSGDYSMTTYRYERWTDARIELKDEFKP